MTKRSCPACGGWTTTLITHVDLVTPDGHPLQGGYPVASCDQCGTGFADVVPPVDWYDDFYQDGAKYATEEPSEWMCQRSAQTTQRVIDRLELTGNERILDVGSGNGMLVRELRTYGYDAIGLDPSGANGALIGSLSKMPEDCGKYDAIILAGVLEHVWDVDLAMKTIASLLAQDGQVYVEVPDAAAYPTSYLGPFEDYNTEHVNHFASHSLRILGQRFGFFSCLSRSEQIPFAEGIDAQYLTHGWRSSVKFNKDLRSSLVAYTNRSVDDLTTINGGLERALGDSPSFNLWGAGECAYRFLALPALRKRKCEHIVDSDEQRRGVILHDCYVYSPDALLDNDSPIVVASLTRSGGILSAAEELGVATRIVEAAVR